MTDGISIGEALKAPLRVIRRHPLSVFVWGFLVVGFGLLAVGLVFGTLAGIPLTEGAEPPPEVFARVMAMEGLSMLLNVGQMALSLILWAATMRATLRIGRRDPFFFLRLGMDELRLAVVAVALFFGVYVAIIILVLLGGGVCAVVWQTSEVAAVATGVLLVLALIVGLVVVMARVSLIAPATMILQRLAFTEGWGLGRGQLLRLTGLLICTWLIYMIVYLTIAFVAIVALFLSGVLPALMTVEPTTFGDLFPDPAWMWSAAAVLLIPGSFLYGAVMTWFSAPFTAVCRDLLDGVPVASKTPDALKS